LELDETLQNLIYMCTEYKCLCVHVLIEVINILHDDVLMFMSKFVLSVAMHWHDPSFIKGYKEKGRFSYLTKP
jgi:hypothetical protein